MRGLWLIPVCLLLILPSNGAADAPAGRLRAGAAAIDITPEHLPVSMTGSFQDRKAAEVHDPLHARCLVLDDGESRVALVVVDSCLITQDIYDAAKAQASEATGIPADRILAAATHTHTAPTAVPLAQCHPDPRYVEQLKRQIAESIRRANARLQPARVGWSVVDESREVSNRRWFVKPEALRPNPLGSEDKVRTNPPRGTDVLIKPAGPVDPEVAFLSVQLRDGRPLALLANYGLHYVGGIPPGQLSADYFGEFARRIGDELEAPESFVGILSNGASGDVNNIDFRNPRPRAAPFDRVKAVSSRIAGVVAKAYRSTDHTDRAGLAMVERNLELGVRRPDAAEIKRARELLADVENPERLSLQELYAQETLRLAKHPATVQAKLQALRIGELGIVAVPCEVFAEIGLEIKERSSLKPTFVIGLANAYHGYLPSPRQHALGGYETWRSGWSYLETEASTKITETALRMLDAVAGDQAADSSE